MRSYENPYDSLPTDGPTTQEVKQDQSQFIVATSKNPGLDVSSEAYRTYTFPGGELVTVIEPQTLWVKKGPAGDSHRIALANGNGVYVRAGWLKIEWANKPGSPPVAW